ncbi:methyl-accepting chemotaxis protein [Denitratisoma oestradiolicum]|uniref:Chemotaxis protein n=1 Tax=Denitratisoma oestradiolicum TaxID=311182 RepID=A0A6S6XVV9_9PROT|nr:Tar ligand binding domain-containing protein [Denitratisoma oestradiolicum]TWO80382.1 hypothetical protein CBW56_09760 [Denitratisoma oestradiolicum]CAB1370184.1 conserved protein of unknown function [Denitratisoma oestradiolicum]
MKKNLPATGQEKIFPADYSLVSRTDTKGIITFANDCFVDVCGFSRQELLGSSHNIVRHPDVPPVIFETMWNTIEHGFPWHGVVKNRCKNGDHYWVDAKVVPVKKNGAITGYMSVRSAPTREAIAQAEQAYKDAEHATASVSDLTGTGWKRMFSIKNGVSIGMIFVTLLMIAGGILGITGLKLSNSAMESLYREDMIPVQTIGRINFLMADNRAQVALSLHHNPATHGGENLGHGVDSHIATLTKNKEEIDALWAGYARGIRSGTERQLSDTYWQARNRYVQEGLLQARAALVAGEYPQAERLLLDNVNPLYDAANQQVGILLQHLSDRAQANYQQVAARNQKIALVAVVGIALGALVMLLSGLYFFQVTVLPLQTAVASLEKIADGNLSDTVEASPYGEPGRVLAAVTVMQMHLQVMMNEIRQSSDSIREQCGKLNGTMMNLAEHSEEQHDRVYQTLDAILDSCTGLGALADQVEELAQAIRQEAPGAASAEDDGTASEPGLLARADDVAGAARVQAFTVEDVASQLRQVAALIVQNREEVQAAWAASQHLEKTAQELDRLVKYFD